MLRQKLLVIFFGLALLIVVMAVVALVSLNGVLDDLNALHEHTHSMVERCQNLNATMSQIERLIHHPSSSNPLESDSQTANERLVALTRDAGAQARDLLEHEEFHDPQVLARARGLVEGLNKLQSLVADLPRTDSPLVIEPYLQAMSLAGETREHVLSLDTYAQRCAVQSQAAIVSRFRWLVIGLAVGFFLWLNGSVILLVRAATMVLKPIDRLILASRELGKEHFEHRVEEGRRDEFDELGRAFNLLASQLQQNEKQRLETLGQVALTLNHELNNAIAIIEMQLSLLRRRSASGQTFESCLERIHHSLERMSSVVDGLKQVKRIVLTDYTAGVKMMDLEKSIQRDPSVLAHHSPSGA
ncbi:MAG: HAMP domain-containing protein [Phycisphaera sp.]|nr:HAMP domain-containing protein [Phycisphaera sp.]